MKPARLLQALEFAANKHRDRRRKGIEATPYEKHVISVATVLAVEGGISDEVLLVAAILHDTLEDTDTEFVEPQQIFGPRVAALVSEVTDDKAPQGRAEATADRGCTQSFCPG